MALWLHLRVSPASLNLQQLISRRNPCRVLCRLEAVNRHTLKEWLDTQSCGNAMTHRSQKISRICILLNPD